MIQEKCTKWLSVLPKNGYQFMVSVVESLVGDYFPPPRSCGKRRTTAEIQAARAKPQHQVAPAPPLSLMLVMDISWSGCHQEKGTVWEDMIPVSALSTSVLRVTSACAHYASPTTI